MSLFDSSAAEQFLRSLDPNAKSFTFQTFDDNEDRKNPELARVFHGTLTQHAADLAQFNARGAGIFVTVNETDGKGRKKENITKVRAVFVDLDGAPIEPVTEWHLKPHIVVQSSAGKWHAYWRVSELPLQEFSKVQKQLINQFNADPVVHDLSRVMRLPGFMHGKKALFRTRIASASEFAPYDASHFLQLIPKITKGRDARGDEPRSDSPEMDKTVDLACDAVRSAQEGTRNIVLNRAAFTLGQLIGGATLDEKMVRKRLTAAAIEAGLGENEIKATVSSGIEAGIKVPVIFVKAGELSAIATRSEQLLRSAGVAFYQRAGMLVRPIIEEVDAAHGRRTKVARLQPISAIYLRDVLSKNAAWRKVGGRSGLFAIDPPADIAHTILARAGEWGFHTLAGVITTPTMRPDGTILDKPGYDKATRLLLVDPPCMPKIADAPTLSDAQRAVEMLKDLLREFAFKDEIARSVALSAIITPVARGAFPVAPAHVARAPVAASGKSYLFDVVAAIAIGQLMPVMAAGRNEEETEKRLGAALMSGQPLISIDNVNGELSGDALCQIIERPVVEIRILGKSERVRIEARGTTLFFTGNNIVLVGDLCRRAITATLDPKLERPELRQFKGNPVAEVLANRGEFIAAALTVCRAYIVAGRPNLAPRLASFEPWSDTVRSALMWTGEPDPVGSMEIARAEDPELNALRELLAGWADVFGVGWKFRRTLADVIATIDETRGQNEELKWPVLNSAVQAIAGGRGGAADARKLGAWVRGKKERVVDDLRLESKADPKGGSEWWITHTEGEEGERAGRWEDRSKSPADNQGVAHLNGKESAQITFAMCIENATEKAIFASTADAPAVWLPLSMIKVEEPSNGSAHVTMPRWLAKEKGLERSSSPVLPTGAP